MLRLALHLVAGLALTAASPVPASGDTPPEAKATHTLILDYQQTRGDMRRAMLKIAPKDEGVRPLWQGKLRAVSVLTTKGQWILIESFLSSGHATGHHAEARVMLPDPNTISAILLHPERGGMVGWKVEEGEPSYTEVEWTYLTQDGEETEEPEPEEPADDDKPCNMVDVRDPYTGECGESELKDPYENEASPSQILLGIG